MDAENPSGSATGLEGVFKTPSSGETSSGAGANANVSAAAQEIGKRKRGRPPGSKNSGGGNVGGSNGPIPLSNPQFAQLFDPELWGRVLAAPGAAMAGITGKERWLISAEEKKALGATGSIAAQCWAVTDPKWLAASLALITVIEVYGVRFAAEMVERNAELKKKREEQRRSSGA